MMQNEENFKNKKNYEKLTDYELNSLSYEEAIKYDKRTYFQLYCGLLKEK